MSIRDTIRRALARPGDRLRLRQATSTEEDGPWWMRIHVRAAGTLGGRRPIPLVKCPSGHRIALSSHEVDGAGLVSPRAGCPEDGCGWAAWLELEGWAS